ncbi:unnamed protein product [Rhizoctonia solani]|uniref:Uncharacterized protein n=1 Tax=Rhizoctonia solani TaxID=456999 RepID=A0A8H3E4T2_9AGAM|nr:unnamed protein product [Rhizoctonia solani]
MPSNNSLSTSSARSPIAGWFALLLEFVSRTDPPHSLWRKNRRRTNTRVGWWLSLTSPFVLFPMRASAFGDDSPKNYDLIKTDDGDRPQLVHYQYYIGRPSRLVRFATRLELAKGDQPVLEAVEKAYEFIAGNYASGDQVILCVWTYYDNRWETSRYAKALEILARHLHDGTIPAKLADAHPGNEEDMTGSQIPIHAVVASPPYLSEIQSMCTWSDWLKSRLPLGIRHIACYSDYGDFRSCSTTYDLDGEIISRELRFSSYDGRFQSRRDATKHVLYYKQDWLPKWDKHQLVWTRVLHPSSHQAQDASASESMKPAGMHHHEVQRYQGLLGAHGHGGLCWCGNHVGKRPVDS